MFNKEKFSEILNKIYSTYHNQRDFANAMGISRGYLSQYINKKLDNPPTPKIIERIAINSNSITTYYELMEICGYIENDKTINMVTNSLTNLSDFYTVHVFISDKYKLLETNEDFVLPFKWEKTHQYFAYKTNNDDMLPLLGNGDIAIIEKTDQYESGNTCLISLDNEQILIRKIIEFKEQGYIELHTAFPYGQPIKLTYEEKEKRNLKILGKVIRVENSSAFK